MTTLNAQTADIPHNEFYKQHKLSWWDLNSGFRCLIQANDLSLRYIKNGLVECEERFRLSKSLHVLDVGCGGGLLTEPMARADCDTLGIDINKTAVDVAKEHAALDPCLKNNLVPMGKYRGPLFTECGKVFIKSCLKNLKPGGLLFLSGTSKTIKSWLKIILVEQMIFGHFPADTFHWHKFINFGDVKQILENCNCVVEGTTGIYYDIFSSHWRCIDSTNGAYITHATKH